MCFLQMKLLQMNFRLFRFVCEFVISLLHTFVVVHDEMQEEEE